MWSTRRQLAERVAQSLHTAGWREQAPWLPIPAPEPEPESVQVSVSVSVSVSVLARVASAQAQEGVLGPGLADWTSSGKRSCLRASTLHFRIKTT